MGEQRTQDAEDYRRVAEAIEFIDARARAQPSLDDVAEAVGLSPHHFHRIFRRWAGTTPKRFLQLLTLDDARARLESSRTVLHTAYDVGLSGPGRLHDLFVTVDAVTPGEFAGKGAGVTITYGTAATPFGTAVIGRTDRGICHLSFIDPDAGTDRSDRLAARSAGTVDAARAGLAGQWPEAELHRDDAVARSLADTVFRGDRPPLHVRGTNFQLQVWSALLAIPEGHVAAYGDVARGVDRPGAARAVAGALASNRVAWLIPCHRVIRSVGETGGYRWGTARKRAMLAWEAARTD